MSATMGQYPQAADSPLMNGRRRWYCCWSSLCRRRDGHTDRVLAWSFGTFVPSGSFWDFGLGKLAERWEAGRDLSVVGRTFAELESR